jgi:hypothetical protein
MTDIAIRAKNLSKLYRIGPRQRYRTLRDTLTYAMHAPFSALATVFSGRRSSVVGPPSSVLGPPSSVIGPLAVLRRRSSRRPRWSASLRLRSGQASAATGPARARCSRSFLVSQNQRKGAPGFVAAHLEPGILLVDEVLAVGDGAFEKKCRGKMTVHLLN